MSTLLEDDRVNWSHFCLSWSMAERLFYSCSLKSCSAYCDFLWTFFETFSDGSFLVVDYCSRSLVQMLTLLEDDRVNLSQFCLSWRLKGFSVLFIEMLLSLLWFLIDPFFFKFQWWYLFYCWLLSKKLSLDINPIGGW